MYVCTSYIYIRIRIKQRLTTPRHILMLYLYLYVLSLCSISVLSLVFVTYTDKTCVSRNVDATRPCASYPPGVHINRAALRVMVSIDAFWVCALSVKAADVAVCGCVLQHCDTWMGRQECVCMLLRGCSRMHTLTVNVGN